MSEDGIVFGGAVSAICAISCIAAIAVVASVEFDKDGKISFDEELFEEIYKTLVGAYIPSLDSGTSDSLDLQSLKDKTILDHWRGKVTSLVCGDNTGGALIDAQQEANARYIYAYLTAKGWSKNAICGLLGNMEGESHMNPGSWENLNVIANNSGYGLVQWTSPSKYLDWAVKDADNNKEKIDKVNKMDGKELMDNQLEFIQYQLTITDGRKNEYQWKSTTSHGSPYSMEAKDYIKCDNHSAYELALVWRGSFERPSTPIKEGEERAKNAEKWSKIFP